MVRSSLPRSTASTSSCLSGSVVSNKPPLAFGPPPYFALRRLLSAASFRLRIGIMTWSTANPWLLARVLASPAGGRCSRCLGAYARLKSTFFQAPQVDASAEENQMSRSNLEFRWHLFLGNEVGVVEFVDAAHVSMLVRPPSTI